jgi:hypothetical protein
LNQPRAGEAQGRCQEQNRHSNPVPDTGRPVTPGVQIATRIPFRTPAVHTGAGGAGCRPPGQEGFFSAILCGVIGCVNCLFWPGDPMALSLLRSFAPAR